MIDEGRRDTGLCPISTINNPCSSIRNLFLLNEKAGMIPGFFVSILVVMMGTVRLSGSHRVRHHRHRRIHHVRRRHRRHRRHRRRPHRDAVLVPGLR